jgi:hypothetical protein
MRILPGFPGSSVNRMAQRTGSVEVAPLPRVQSLKSRKKQKYSETASYKIG